MLILPNIERLGASNFLREIVFEMTNKRGHPSRRVIRPRHVERPLVDMRVGDKNILLVPGDEHHARTLGANEPTSYFANNSSTCGTRSTPFLDCIAGAQHVARDAGYR